MADITDPVAIAHCNRYLRAMAEGVRNLYFQMKIHKAAWDALAYGEVFVNSPTDLVIDDRQEGEHAVAQLTAQEARRIGMLLPDAVIALLEGTQATGLAACVKGAVRPLKVID